MRLRTMLYTGAALAATAALVGCQDQPLVPLVHEDSGAQTLLDGSTGGNPRFFFLPPLGSTTTFEGVFDGSHPVEVAVCALSDGACAAEIARFTRTSEGDRRIVVSAQHYGVVWHTDRHVLDPQIDYRIRILVGNDEIGRADIDIVPNASTVGKAGFVRVVLGQAVPVHFRIEEGMTLGNDLVNFPGPDFTTVHINPLDPILLTIPGEGNDFVELWGEKDELGFPTSLSGLSVRNAANRLQREDVSLDHLGRPAYYRDREGGQIYFEYLSPTRFRMRIVAPDGNEVITYIDAASTSPQALASLRGAAAGYGVSRIVTTEREVAAWKARDARLAHEAVRTGAVSPVSTSTTVGIVEVTIRAGAEGQTVPITRANVSGFWELLGTNSSGQEVVEQAGNVVFPVEVTDGVWMGRMSYQEASMTPAQFDEACRLAEEKAGDICKFLGVFKEALQAGCGALGFSPKHRSICRGFVEVVDQGCSKGLGSCDLVKKGLDAYVRRGQSVEVRVVVGGWQLVEYTASSFERFSPPLPNPMRFAFVVPLRVELSVDPVDPAPFQGYVATTSLMPALAQIPVHMWMSGTDGYSQSRNGLTDAAGRFGMFVPGAQEGVRDDIFTSVAGITRSTSIVF